MLDVQTIFIVYSTGFGLLSVLLWRLNAHALRRADALQLDVLERHELRGEIGMHAVMTLTALASVLLSLAVLAVRSTARRTIALPMWVYAAMGIVLPRYWSRRNRTRPAATGAPAVRAAMPDASGAADGPARPPGLPAGVRPSPRS